MRVRSGSISVLLLLASGAEAKLKLAFKNIFGRPKASVESCDAAAPSWRGGNVGPTPPPLAFLVELLDVVLLQATKVTSGASSRLIRTPSTTFHVLDCPGSGPLPTVVLLHGITSAAHDFDPLIRRLARRCRRIISIDLPGHGRTPLPAATANGVITPQQSDEMLQDVTDCLRALLGTEQFFVFGNSLGGLIAIRSSSILPRGQVLGMVLASPGGAPLSTSELQTLKALFHLDTHARGVALVDMVRSRRPPTAMRHLLAWAVRARAARPAVGALLRAVSMADLLTESEVAAVAAPVLLLWGQQERIFDQEKLAWFQRHLPPSAVVMRPENCGHVPHLDVPDELADAIFAFMTTCCGSDAALEEGAVSAAVSGGAAAAAAMEAEKAPGKCSVARSDALL